MLTVDCNINSSPHFFLIHNTFPVHLSNTPTFPQPFCSLILSGNTLRIVVNYPGLGPFQPTLHTHHTFKGTPALFLWFPSTVFFKKHISNVTAFALRPGRTSLRARVHRNVHTPSPTLNHHAATNTFAA